MKIWKCALLCGAISFIEILSCQAAPPLNADGWTSVFAQLNDPYTWSGADQAVSYRATNGVVYWIFQDTRVGAGEGTNGQYTVIPTGMVPNTILKEVNGVLTSATPGTSWNQAIPNDSDGSKYWPGDMFEANGYAYLLCQTPDGLNSKGTRMAKFAFNGQNLVFQNMVMTPAWTNTYASTNYGPTHAVWARGSVVQNGYVYVYGDAFLDAITWASYVARIPTASVETPSAWQYWNGSTWQTNMASAAPVLNSQMASVRIIQGQFVVSWKQPFTDNVYAAASPNPYGPFSSSTPLYSAPGGTFEGEAYVTYTPALHPDKTLSSGKTLASICWNGTADVHSADLYKPRFCEVTVPGLTMNVGGNLPDGTYKIINRNSGQAAEVYGSGTTNASNVSQWTYFGNANQQWTVTNLGDWNYKIINVNAGKAMEVYGASTANNGNISIWDYFGNSNQIWTVSWTSASYSKVINLNSGKAMEVYGSSTSTGANIEQWDYLGNNNQQWSFQAP